MHKIFNCYLFLILALSLIAIPSFETPKVEGWGGVVDKLVVCEDIDTSGKIRQPVNVKDTFLTSEFRVYAYLLITESKELVNITIEWIEPNGETFMSQEYKPDERPYNITRVSYIEIITIIQKIGDWKVNAYANEELIASTDFNLMPSEPLLSIIEITQNPSGGKPIYIGNPFQITYTVKNVGGATANQVRFSMEDVKPAGSIEISDPSESKDLKSGSTDSWTIELIGRRPGEINGSVKLYLEDKKAWLWEWNIFISLPELDLINQTVYPQEYEPLRPGDNITVRYVFRNIGIADAKKIGISVQVPDGLRLITLTPPKDLEPDQDGEFFVELEAIKDGIFEVNVTVNSYEYAINEGKLTINVSPNFVSEQIIGFIAIIAIFLVIIAIIIIKKKIRKT